MRGPLRCGEPSGPPGRVLSCPVAAYLGPSGALGPSASPRSVEARGRDGRAWRLLVTWLFLTNHQRMCQVFSPCMPWWKAGAKGARVSENQVLFGWSPRAGRQAFLACHCDATRSFCVAVVPFLLLRASLPLMAPARCWGASMALLAQDDNLAPDVRRM